MKVRLIKADTSPPTEKDKPPPVEVPIVDTIQSWVRDFKSDKADKARLDSRLIRNSWT